MQFFFFFGLLCKIDMYMRVKRLRLGCCTPCLTKILYLTSDYNDKGARWYAVDVKVLGKSKIHFHLAI